MELSEESIALAGFQVREVQERRLHDGDHRSPAPLMLIREERVGGSSEVEVSERAFTLGWPTRFSRRRNGRGGIHVSHSGFALRPSL